MTVPHDVGAEEALLGALVLSGDARDQVSGLVAASDFYSPRNGEVFDAVMDLWRAGHAVDVLTVRDRMKADRDTHLWLTSVVSATPATTSARRYASIVTRHALARRLIRLGEGLAAEAHEQDPYELLDAHLAALGSLELPAAGLPDGVWELGAFLDRPEDVRAPWVIPGLLRAGWRVMVVAPEGFGKSVAFRQLAVLAAQGLHPFGFEATPPVRTLIVDLENPDDAITATCTPLRVQSSRVVGEWREGTAWLWHRPGGLDLRSRAGRVELEQVVARCRPQALFLGPLYKAYHVKSGENDELAAGEVQKTLDSLRTRYRFGLLLEHHAPKKQQGVRELAPYGSSLWLRWPEIGLKLVPEDEAGKVMLVKRWRGDRLPNSWPDRLERGDVWPWVGVWRQSKRTVPA